MDLCNAAAERAQRAQEVAELGESVDDWKGHRLDHFGDLVISGQHTVLKGDTAKAEEREVSGDSSFDCLKISIRARCGLEH